MKIHALNSEVEKLTARLERAQNDRERIEAKLESSQSELGKLMVKQIWFKNNIFSWLYQIKIQDTLRNMWGETE